MLFFSIVFSLIIYAHEVEKLGEIKGIVAVHGIAGSPGKVGEKFSEFAGFRFPLLDKKIY